MTVRFITNTLVSNRTFTVPYLISLCFGTIALMMWEKEELFFRLHDVHTPWGDLFFQYFTHFGDGFFVLVVIGALLFVHFGKAVFLLLAFLFSGLIAQILKKLVFSDSLRPSGWQWADPEALLQMVEGVTYHSAHSFPSGHTISAYTMFFVLTLVARKKRFGYLFFAMAFLTGYSRVYLGQHFFEDVYFGSVIALLCTMIVWVLFYPHLDKPWAGKSLFRLKS